MMKSQSLICSVAVAGTLLAATAFPSAAATYFVDVVETPLVGAVDFTYDITLSAPTSLTISGFEAGITNFDASLFNGGTKLTSATQASPTPPFFFTLIEPVLSAGTYILQVTGNADTGGFGVKALGDSPLTVSATPIPGTLVLFLSGLGLLGFWGWNKGRKAGSDSASLEAAAC